MDFMKIHEKYNGTTRVPSYHDCLTMLIEYLDDDNTLDVIKGRYKTERGAKRLTEFKATEQYLLSLCNECPPLLCRDGDIITFNNHSGIYWQGHCLMVSNNNSFILNPVDLYLNTDIRVFRKRN